MASPRCLMQKAELAAAWECCKTIRSRFRREMSWLQFPVNGVDACPDEAQPNDDEDGNPLPKHPVCTKSLELNADAVAAMLDHYDGKFIEIPTLQREAPLLLSNSHLLQKLFYRIVFEVPIS